MKKLLVAVAALGLAFTAKAGDYHKAATLRCSQCHTMHASRSHSFNGESTQYWQSVTLNGTASDDGDGGRQGLTFRWTKTSGPPCSRK